VFSFARYACEDRALTLRRCCGVLAHEIGHLFGIAHCVSACVPFRWQLVNYRWFECLMNGSNHDEESDARPWRLCPVDLRKLRHAMREVGGLDIAARAVAIADFCDRLDMPKEAEWYRRSLEMLPQE